MNTSRLVRASFATLGFTLSLAANAQVFPQGQTMPQQGSAGRPVAVLMRDGSVRWVTTNVDPGVLRAIQDNQEDGYGIQRIGGTPIQVRPNADARNRLGGYLVNTEQGLDAQVGFLRQAPQNWNFATGELIYSYQAIRITNSRLTADQLYAMLQRFDQFSAGNVAEARVVTGSVFDPNFRDRNFVIFRARPEYPGLVGVLNGLQEFVNPSWVPVEVFSNPGQRNVTAVTLGNHMIVGSRRWTIQPQADGSIVVETEAWEARNGQINDVAMRTGVPGILNGREVMGMVWDRYLRNIGTAATQGGGSFDYVQGVGRDGVWRTRPAGTRNPFQAGIPGSGVPGPAVANGFYGPSFREPAPPALPAVSELTVPRQLLRMTSTIQCHQPQNQNSDGFRLSLSGFDGVGLQMPRRGASNPGDLEALRQFLAQPAQQGGAGIRR